MERDARCVSCRKVILDSGQLMTVYTVEVTEFAVDPSMTRHIAEGLAMEEVEELDVDEWVREFKRQTGKDCHV